MSILARKAQKTRQPPKYNALETLSKEVVDILEELVDHWSLEPNDGNDGKIDVMESKIKTAIETAKNLGL